MVEKNKDHTEIREIVFNWERVKIRAASKREDLVSNAPNVSRRSNQPTSQPPLTGDTTSTTDTLIDPYYNIKIQANKKASHEVKSASPNPGERTYIHTEPYNNNNDDIHMDTIGTVQAPHGTLQPQPQHGTDNPSLLPRPAAHQEGSTSLVERSSSNVACGDESLGPDRNAVAIIKAIKDKETTGKELTIDERRLVVKSMKELGQTQDAIADLLKISRRTVVSDYKLLRQEQALAIASTETHEIAGEVYAIAKTCIRRAMQAGSFKTVSVIMRDMVEVLQSLGVVHRAPKTSMQATGHFSLNNRNKGYQKYMDTIGEDKNKVVEVLDCMFTAIEKGTVPEQDSQ